MAFKIDDFIKTYQPKPTPKPPVQQPTVQPQYNNEATRRADVQNYAATNRAKLDRQLAADKPTPYKALEQINDLPKPDLNDKAAITEYKTQRKEIADNAIKNSQPPRIEDFRNTGLNGPTAQMEYENAKNAYDTQIRRLQTVSADAETYPDRILSSGEAVIEINNLPRPDRNDPQAVLAYNNQRAAIADAALLYAQPPNRQDFLNSGLNRPTAEMEYRDALTSYNSSVEQLKDASIAGGTTALPQMTDAEVNALADEYIQNHNGVKNEDDGYGVGRDVAALAKTDPEGAALVMAKVQEKLNGTTYGDNVASGFVQNSSVEELRRFSQNGGEAVLRDLQHRLTTGDVHDNERAEARKIDVAITGFDPQSLTGNPEQDAKTIDEQLKNLPPSMHDDYIKEVLKHPYGSAIKYALEMSPEGQQMLGTALGELYRQNPTETAELLKNITDAPNGSLYPVTLQSGLAEVISKSGNDDLIKSFAQNEINRAKGNPDEVRGYINAVTAYAGLSPEALQDVMKNNPDFFKAVDEAGRILDAAGNNVGTLDPNIFEPGLGNLLKKASQIKDANGNATPEAIKLFEHVVEHSGDNISTKEGLGAFFIEHAQQLVDKYTDPTNPDALNSTVLETFFADVVYHPLSDLTKYNGQSLTEAIMGNANGEGGVIGDVVQTYLDAANKVPNDGEKDDILGQRIGVLWGSMSKGFLTSVDRHKDKWKEDKEFRDFTINMLSFGLGKIADKFGVPGEVVDKPLEFVQKMLDSKAEADQEKQIEAFKTAFKEFNTTMYARLNTYDQNNPNVENMNTGFSKAYNLLLINEIIDREIESE